MEEGGGGWRRVEGAATCSRAICSHSRACAVTSRLPYETSAKRKTRKTRKTRPGVGVGVGVGVGQENKHKRNETTNDTGAEDNMERKVCIVCGDKDSGIVRFGRMGEIIEIRFACGCKRSMFDACVCYV